ncbi:MAG: (Fe-S)-binding protein [Syntrophaceticus schinkii]
MDNKTIKEYLNRCSKCGGCQAVCPLYGETHSEPLVARGKLFLMKNYLDGNLELSPKMMELMSLCLLCKACTVQCPNRIPVDELVLSIRREIAHQKGIPFVKKNVFHHLLQNNGRLTWQPNLLIFTSRAACSGLCVKPISWVYCLANLPEKKNCCPE